MTSEPGGPSIDQAANDAQHPVAEPIMGEALQALAQDLSAVVQRAVQNHIEWVNGYMQWCQAQMMAFQPISPASDMEFANRQDWIIGFLKQFERAGQILAAAGDTRLSGLLALYLPGLQANRTAFGNAQAAMAADNATTATAVRNIYAGMNQQNADAAAANLSLQQQTAKDVFNIQNTTLQHQQDSFQAHNNAFLNWLKS